LTDSAARLILEFVRRRASLCLILPHMVCITVPQALLAAADEVFE